MVVEMENEKEARCSLVGGVSSSWCTRDVGWGEWV